MVSGCNYLRCTRMRMRMRVGRSSAVQHRAGYGRTAQDRTGQGRAVNVAGSSKRRATGSSLSRCDIQGFALLARCARQTDIAGGQEIWRIGGGRGCPVQYGFTAQSRAEGGAGCRVACRCRCSCRCAGWARLMTRCKAGQLGFNTICRLMRAWDCLISS